MRLSEEAMADSKSSKPKVETEALSSASASKNSSRLEGGGSEEERGMLPTSRIITTDGSVPRGDMTERDDMVAECVGWSTVLLWTKARSKICRV
jgi:hypothetical protein